MQAKYIYYMSKICCFICPSVSPLEKNQDESFFLHRSGKFVTN